MICDKGAKATQKIKDSPFQQKVQEQFDIHRPKKWTLWSILVPYTKINSKQNTDLNIKHNVIKLEENLRQNPCDPALSKDYLDKTPKAQFP